ncbi:MAG: hypothetical protein IJS15_08875 [Victivallales bacterium]|nr:hypothetical protein [Victivallales bacterium]
MEEASDNGTKWYVIQAMSGKEKKVFSTLDFDCSRDSANVILDENGGKRLYHSYFRGLISGVFELVIPYERIEERKVQKNSPKGTVKKESIKTRLIYPGYILVKMKMYDESGKMINDNVRALRDVNGVIGFLGGVSPTPLSPDEVGRMLKTQSDVEQDKPKPKVQYNVGETVIINNGSFEGCEGTIEVVDSEHEKLKVSVFIFERYTPVEVDFGQVERHTP